jgi:hypothetical protein
MGFNAVCRLGSFGQTGSVNNQRVSLAMVDFGDQPFRRLFSYRLPFVRKWLTLYSDSFAHDDVSPISAPRRAAIRPGIYLSHVSGLPHLDFRVEAASTDPPTNRSNGGQSEEVQKGVHQ